MNFNSAEYLLFLPAVALLAFALRGSVRARHLLLLAASYYFYMSWDWRYAGLIAFSTAVDYAIGWGLYYAQGRLARRLLLLASLVTNLGLLATFKYFNFFSDTAAEALGVLGHTVDLPRLHWLLPVGISFYTFQTLSYTIDVYRRVIPVERDPINFALFVAFFPQLVAGPIVRASDFLPQLRENRTPRRRQVDEGLALIAKGLVKKVLVADLLAVLLVDPAFASPASYSSLSLYVALVGYAFQIYCDFSGYTDIAIGSAALLGFHLPENFRKPYLAVDMRDFWGRWHISLSTWLRDYLYIPLGGSRLGPGRTATNLMATMTLGGLWHGAAMNFVLWGVYHGGLLVLTHWFSKRSASPDSMAMRFGRRFVCFHLVLFGWLLFRVTGMQNFYDYSRGMLTGTGGFDFDPLALTVLALGFVTHIGGDGKGSVIRERFLGLPAPLQAICYAVLFWVCIGASLDAPSFIYFQF